VQPPESQHPDIGIDLERIIFFSDAVFAIAITLLVIDLKPPVLQENIPAAEILPALGNLFVTGQTISFLISFLVIGTYWVAHHRNFRYIRGYDGRLIWLNLLFLLSIAFLPYPTAVLRQSGDQQIAVIFYAISIAFTGLLLAFLWIYASRGHRLIDENMNSHLISYFTWRSLSPAVIFVLSIPISFISPYLSMVFWLLIMPVHRVLNRIYGYRG